MDFPTRLMQQYLVGFPNKIKALQTLTSEKLVIADILLGWISWCFVVQFWYWYLVNAVHVLGDANWKWKKQKEKENTHGA